MDKKIEVPNLSRAQIGCCSLPAVALGHVPSLFEPHASPQLSQLQERGGNLKSNVKSSARRYVGVSYSSSTPGMGLHLHASQSGTQNFEVVKALSAEGEGKDR